MTYRASMDLTRAGRYIGKLTVHVPKSRENVLLYGLPIAGDYGVHGLTSIEAKWLSKRLEEAAIVAKEAI